MHLPLLGDMLILLSFSVGIVFLLQRLKLPSILGFIITGLIIGPFGLSLVQAVEEVEIISEIGVILLLFVIGMEMSIKQLLSMKKTVFIGGSLQVGLTLLLSGLAYYSLGYSINESVFIGFLFSLSSTAVILKVLQDRNEMFSPHGRIALGILIFQDIIVVPMMLIVPLMAGESDNIASSVLSLLLKSIIVIAITVVSARYVVPKLMYAIAKTKSKELFLLTTITLCFAVAFLTSEAGLSLALGAFMAGLIISESEYSHQATSIILPFRELFISFFFISVGMLLNLGFFFEHLGFILGLVALVFIAKSTIAAFAIAILGFPMRTVLIAGLSLFQVGEFSFILSKVGIEYGLIDETTNQYFLAVSIVSMLLTPFVIIASERIANRIVRTRLMKKMQSFGLEHSVDKIGDYSSKLENHLIIIGYGINGSNLTKAAIYSEIPYVVVELNPDVVRSERAKGVNIHYGDATQNHILESLDISSARAVVVAISDEQASKQIIKNIRGYSQSVFVLIRTRFVKEIKELIAFGADEVIPEEFETSVEIFSRILHKFLVPEDDIHRFVEHIRADNYQVFSSKQNLPRTFRAAGIPDFNITCVKVNKETGKLIGKSIRDLDIRNKYGINILAMARNEQLIPVVKPDEQLAFGDKLYIQGSAEKIEVFQRLLN